jgi:flagellar M-ring protein FliF
MLNLVRSAVGYSEARGDVVTVAPARFESLAPEPAKPWYENGDIQNFIKIGLAALVIIVFMLAVVRPLVKGPTINQIMPPVVSPTAEELKALEDAKAAAEAKAAEEAQAAAEERAAEEARIAEEEAAAIAAEEEEAAALLAEEEEAAALAAAEEGELELAEGEIEMQEGETLDELKARMQAMKPKKPTFTADMLDTANSYDDKVALIRMLVSQESGRVALVLKNMVKS